MAKQLGLGRRTTVAEITAVPEGNSRNDAAAESGSEATGTTSMKAASAWGKPYANQGDDFPLRGGDDLASVRSSFLKSRRRLCVERRRRPCWMSLRNQAQQPRVGGLPKTIVSRRTNRYWSDCLL